MEKLNATAGDSVRERALFEAALDLAGEARVAFLREQCGSDAVSRSRS